MKQVIKESCRIFEESKQKHEKVLVPHNILM